MAAETEYIFVKNSSLVTIACKALNDRILMCDELKINSSHTAVFGLLRLILRLKVLIYWLYIVRKMEK